MSRIAGQDCTTEAPKSGSLPRPASLHLIGSHLPDFVSERGGLGGCLSTFAGTVRLHLAVSRLRMRLLRVASSLLWQMR